jgi:thiol-disulfide isomerase/thioredoxin
MSEMVVNRREALAGGTVAAALALCKPRAAAAAAIGLKLVDPAAKPPEVAFERPDGTKRRLSDYRGQGLVVNLWATWCVPCVAELPSLDALARAVAADRIAVLPISADRGGAPVVEAFYKVHAISALPVLLDPDGALMQAFGVRGVPTTYLIDRAGMERAYAEGGDDWGTPDAAAAVKKIVGGGGGAG